MYSTLFYDKEITQEMKEVIEKIENQINNKEIPDFYPEYMVNGFSIERHFRRDKFIEQMGFALISNDWIIPLSKWIGNRKCLEVMAGTGALSYALQKQGISIIATDNFSWNGEKNWNKDGNYWTDIENIDAMDAIKKYGKDINIIIMSWAFMDDTAYRVIQTIREVNSNCIMIVIGEREGGCTANDEFFKTLIEIEDNSFNEAVKEYKQWWGIHDYPQLIK